MILLFLNLGAILNITYNKNINVLKGPGIELTGLINGHQSSSTNKNDLMLQDLQFVSHDDPQTKA